MVNASPFDEASLDGRNAIAPGPESVQRALASLDALDSAILRLVCHQHMSQAEVAQQLGLPISEVRTVSPSRFDSLPAFSRRRGQGFNEGQIAPESRFICGHTAAPKPKAVTMTTMTDLDPTTEQLCALIEHLPVQSLGHPTPCTEYTVGDLLDHLAGVTVAFGGAAVKATGASSTMGPWGDAAHLEPDWPISLPQRLRDLATAWRNPGAWTGTARVGGQEQPAEVTAIILLGELVVHGWDLFRGAGLPFAIETAGLVPLHDLIRETFGPNADPATRGPAFQPAVPVSGDASLLDQTLGMLGRDPAWHRTVVPGAEGSATRR